MFRTLVLALIFVIYIFPILVKLAIILFALLVALMSEKRFRIALCILLFFVFIS